jgi:hypothetical protein
MGQFTKIAIKSLLKKLKKTSHYKVYPCEKLIRM